MKRLFSQKTILILTLSTLVVGCASSTQVTKGKVVQLEESFDGSAQKTQEQPVMTKVQRQVAVDVEKAVPVDTEDAAAFYFSMGQAYSLDNDIPRAIEAYRATLVYDPKSALVNIRLAAELVKQGNFLEARELCEKAILFDAKYVDSYLLLAGIQVSAKEYSKAIVTYKQALKIAPKSRDALLYYGVTLAETGKVQDALVQLRALTKIKDSADSNIDQSVSYYYLAKVAEQGGFHKEAIEALHNALDKRGNFTKAAIMLANIYLQQNQRGKAYKILEDSFKEQPQAEIAEHLAGLYLEEQKYKEAVVYLETIVEEDPTNENIRVKLGLVYWQLKWLDKAHTVFSSLYQRFPASDEILFYMGELEWEKSGGEVALPYYKKIHTEHAKYEQAIARMGIYYRENKQTEASVDLLWDAIKKRPDIMSFYNLLAAFYEEQNKIQDALAVMELGRKQFPNEETVLYYLGFLYDRTNDKALALKTMEKLLSINPNNASALNFVGYTLLESGKELEKAEKYLAQAYKLKPKDAYILDSYGWLLFKRGKTKDAMKHLEQAHNLKSKEAVIAEHLADIYIAMHMQQKALVAYKKALDLGAEEGIRERLQLKIANVENSIAQTIPQPKIFTTDKGRMPASAAQAQ